MATEEPSEHRKSVAFTEEKTMVDADGSVTVEAAEQTAGDAPAENDGLDLSLLKKKKKKVKKADDAAGSGDDEAAEGVDLTMMKKKKKKKTTTAAGVAGADEDEFAKKLEALKLEGTTNEDGTTGAAAAAGTTESAAAVDDGDGDMVAGTGVWAHDEDKPIKYDLLLNMFFSLLAERNPDYAQGSSRSMKIPPPQCLREGPKKTIFANIAEICKRLKRSEEHAASYLFAELGTNGSVDGSRRLVIKGRFQQKQIEAVLRTYIIEYVTCRTCRSPDTAMERGENRLYFVTCNSCGSRRSVQAIKTGFSAQVGKRKKMQG